jgi:hypothetical protein
VTYATTALAWLADHPNPRTTGATGNPQAWADQVSDEITGQVLTLVDQLAPPIPNEGFMERRARLTTARHQAEELVLADRFPTPTPNEDSEEDWEPTIPDVTDLL